MSRKSQRRNRKKRKQIRRRRKKYTAWTEPEGKEAIVYVGGSNNGIRVVDSHTTKRQIEYLKSKKSLLCRNDKIIDIDKIAVNARKPVSIFQHRFEYSTVMAPTLFAYETDQVIHPEKLKSDFNQLYISDIQQMGLFEYICLDRKMRCDGNILMADRPPFVVVTMENDSIVRLEFYKGHDGLIKQVDLRADSLQKKDLADSFTDTSKYNVAKNEYCFAGMYGISLDDFNEMVELAHDALFCDYCQISFGDHTFNSAA